MVEPRRTPLGELFMTDPPPCVDHAPQPGDEELGKALMKMWSVQILARCVDLKPMLAAIRHD